VPSPERSLFFHGGVVRTMDARRPTAAALLIEGDHVADLTDDVSPPAGADTVDLGGACVLPGFTDAHVHFPSWALGRHEVRLFDARSLADALGRVRAAQRGAGPGHVLRGRGWRDALWPEQDRPTRHGLDAALPDAPVALRSHDGHSLWLNSAALALAGGDLEVDGGVDAQTAPACAQAGATLFVAGSAIFGASDPGAAYQAIAQAAGAR